MSDRPDPQNPTPTIDGIKTAVGGPVPVPHRPEGSSDATPLTGHGLSKPNTEPASGAVTPQQGAGRPGFFLAPSPGEPTDGSVRRGFLGSTYSPGELTRSQAGPLSVADLAPGPGLVRPDGGQDGQSAAPAGAATDPRLGLNQDGQNLNPGLTTE